MRKFKFKLDGVVKLREFREYKAKVELGRINLEMGKIREKIEELNISIQSTFEMQNEYLQTPTSGQVLKSFALNITGARELIKEMNRRLLGMQVEYEKRRQDLLLARADLKLIQKLKAEKQSIFKFEYEKKINQEVQEIYQSRISQQSLEEDREKSDEGKGP